MTKKKIIKPSAIRRAYRRGVTVGRRRQDILLCPYDPKTDMELYRWWIWGRAYGVAIAKVRAMRDAIDGLRGL